MKTVICTERFLQKYTIKTKFILKLIEKNYFIKNCKNCFLTKGKIKRTTYENNVFKHISIKNFLLLAEIL